MHNHKHKEKKNLTLKWLKTSQNTFATGLK